MDIKDTSGGALFVKRIEELLQSNALPPDTVLNILRSARADKETDPLKELERLQGERNTE
jgi:hypothetical protein